MLMAFFQTGLRRVVPLLVLGLLIGCGSGTYRLSGKVSFLGKPVPAGKIYITPDTSKGNKGPTGYADIRDGYYDTSSTGGSGVVAGPVILALEGIDPSAAPDKGAGEDVKFKVLFPRYETTAELPSSSSTKDIEVPADAAKGPKQTKKDGPAIIP